MLNQLEITLERESRILPSRMKRRHEDSEAKMVRHQTPCQDC
jgi:hypothetical protein